MYNLTAVLAALQLGQSYVNPSPGAASSEVVSAFQAVNGGTRGHRTDCIVEPYDVLVPVPAFQPYEETKANVYRYRQQQGVNLGSLFVHEQWMTASLFECAKKPRLAEFDIAGGWGGQASARAVLEKHWDTFVTADTFTYLASVGINTVRIPIGHYILGSQFIIGTPFEPFIDVYKNAWPRLLRVINQAAEVGIGVLIDMHAAPGSQNGQQHSGVSDGQTNFFKTQAYQDLLVEALKYLVVQLGPITNVIGIQILNEPVADPSLESFYSRAIDNMRQVPKYGKIPIYIHDAFDLNRFLPFVAGRRDFVVQDHHSYFVFTDSDSKTPADQQTANVKSSISDSFVKAALTERRNLVIGEWSCALTEGSLSSQRDRVQAQRDFCSAQLEMYSSVTAGWYFWSWDNKQCQNDVGWCFKHAVGIALPQTFFTYRAITSASQAQDVAAKVDKWNPLSDDEVSTILHPSSGDVQRQHPGIGSPQHRFGTIYEKRQAGELQSRQAKSQTSSVDNPSRIKGVRDGYQTAKVFATYGMSKLAFVEQYIQDAILRAGSDVIPSGTEGDYHDGFLRGLAYGEQKIKVLANLGSP
ncbi:CAZyme family GH5 [Agaricus bisporus var. burnettii]|uniref:CAZyme family GH5 n=1 Tax=Agaricus bisporus var. burnettii TaxID=192524 RepID=A0A8H7KIB9_AGABI|nr:CAZyme family GH5 [Agaricus bisporus var. burnettii]